MAVFHFIWIIISSCLGLAQAGVDTTAVQALSPAAVQQWQALRTRAEQENWADDKTWRRLLYFQDGATIIRLDDAGRAFFYNSAGAKDANAELLAFLEAVGQPLISSDLDAHARCRFPARVAWLRQQAPDLTAWLAPPRCPRFDRWLEAVQPQSVHLIFAAAFMNSPASMYGHTFLRLGRGGKTRGEEMLDYVVAFGAETGNASGLAYLVAGLTGTFPGYFSTMPYYLKIQEYSNTESRDLWAYKLRLNQEQLHFMVQHLWEVRTVRFDYFFLGKNCSYFLLRLLEVARPDLELAAKMPGWTIPVDTIRILQQAGLVGERDYRPSRASTMFARRQTLAPAEKRLAYAAVKEGPAVISEAEQLTPTRQAKVLDAAYDYFRYRHGAASRLDPEAKRRELDLLAARSQVPTDLQPVAINAVAPEEAHFSNRIGIAGGVAEATEFLQLEWRPALHDLLSAGRALEPYSEQEVLNTRVRVEPSTPQVYLERLDILRIRSLGPLDPWIWKTSWRFNVGTSRLKRDFCSGWRCTLYRLEGGAGLTVPLTANQRNFVFLLTSADIHAGGALSPDYRVGVGPEFGVRLEPLQNWRLLAEWRWKRYFLGAVESVPTWQLGTSLGLDLNSEIRLAWNRERGFTESSLSAFFFF